MKLVRNNAPPLSVLEAIDHESDRLNAVIDTPKGSRCKYKYEPSTGLFRMNKLLPLGAYFPFNYGFVPSTQGEDGDPLDILVLMDEPVLPGCVIPTRLIGVLEARQTETSGKTHRNDRLIGVLETEYNPADIKSIDELSDQCLSEIEHFFIAYNQMEGRKYEPLGRHGINRAKSLLKAGTRQAA